MGLLKPREMDDKRKGGWKPHNEICDNIQYYNTFLDFLFLFFIFYVSGCYQKISLKKNI